MGLCKHTKPLAAWAKGVVHPNHPHPPGYLNKKELQSLGVFAAALCQLSVPTAADAQLGTLQERSMELEPLGTLGALGARCEGSSEPPLLPQEHFRNCIYHLPNLLDPFSMPREFPGAQRISWHWNEFHRSPQGSWNCTPRASNKMGSSEC